MSPIAIGDGMGSGTIPEGASGKPANIEIIVLFERLGAAFSLVGVVLIFMAYAALKKLRTVSNTFIVFASVANLGASIACLIGYSGVLAGSESHLCQAQAFLFELFMQSDPWWSFAMAVNVYMVFFFSANPNNFLRYWYAYFLVCYGIPFIPALWLLVVRDRDGKKVYGDATIWCWIDRDWSDLRIYTYYLPIWVCIILSCIIYLAVGYYVFHQRNQLRNLSLTNPSREPHGARDSGEKVKEFLPWITMETLLTREKDLFTNAAVIGTINREVIRVTTINTESERVTVPTSGTPVGWYKASDESPSHFDRRMSPGSVVATTTTHITAEPRAKESLWRHVKGGFEHWCNKFSHMDPVKLAYLRTSFLFAVSVLITWTPSSINRVHDIVKPNDFSFGLNLASAIVLPLQGLWNAVIFFSTSYAALREELRAKVDHHFRGVPKGQSTADAVRTDRERVDELERRGTRKRDDNSSEISVGSTIGRSGGSQSSSVRVMRDISVASVS